ncbi:MAG: DUF3105 domain-containing protein [Actinomycetota bacterium]|nr:DUF3105 domain-containing protein [Actinomycetota bacterium]
MSKKLEEKQRRRLAEERRRDEIKKATRRRNLVTAAIATLVAVGVVAAVIFQREQEAARLSQDVGVAEREAGCTGVQEHENQGNEHIPVGSAHEPYAGPAPSSGPHYAAPDGPVPGGFYDEPIPPEGPVHNLEHGQIVIWYDPNAPEDVIGDIELVTEQEEFATVAAPYSIQSEKNFVLAAWNTTQECDLVSQSVIDEFRSSFQGKAGPEGQLTRPFEG